MMEFAWPWAFGLLPLPWLVRRLLPPAANQAGAGLRVPSLQDFQLQHEGTAGATVRRWLLFLYVLAWLCLLTAAARPQWIGEATQHPVSGRDLMLAVDLSGSMQTEDFEIEGRILDRLSATKRVAGEFIARRVGDRVGLILYGEKAYLQTPLTFDRTSVGILLNEAAIGLAGQKTAIGDAIGLALKHLEKIDNKDRVLILVTDGISNAGEIEPLKAAGLAARLDTKIYTVGIGAEANGRSLFGISLPQGRPQLDDAMLKAIAKKTGGQYFLARNFEQLQEIYRSIDRLEPVDHAAKAYRPSWSLFYWPLSVAMALSAALALAHWRGLA